MEISHDQDHVDEISQSHFEESVDDNNTSYIVDFLKEIDDDDDNYECLLEENDDDGDIDDNSYIDDRQSQIDTWNFDDHPLFEQDFRCLPLSFHDKINDDLSVGNRIIMPSTDLEFIIENQVPLPLQFEIHNLSEGKFSHCGVLEFSGHEDGTANVDFAPALDYEEHAIPVSINFGLKKKEEKEEETQKSEFKPFTGLARKLNAEPCCSTYLPKIGRNRDVGEANSKRSSICKSEVTNQNKETEDKPKFQAFTVD
ncbi:hypothetical protein Golob_016182 [Gossypium lobatum]|uniref:Ubiquitin fusion degradation protein UFD1 N-terminal subdomain 1 domain-containing protein n=1 Tax=Gossypium lobatum TaxID=34289 RepID=A0A7J8M3D2_9ROSI|nr:hypothetical protein [Gossypium lobatum]